MTRLDKISGVLNNFGRPILDRVGISRSLRVEVIIGIVLVLSTVAFGLGVSIISERSIFAAGVNAAPMGTPEKPVVNSPSTATADDVNVSEVVPQATIQVTIPTVTAQVGTDIDVEIAVGDTTNQGIISYQGDILYDPAVLLPQPSMSAGGFLVQNTISSLGSMTCNPYQSGRIKVAWFIAQPPLEGSGVLFKLKFVVVGPVGSTSPLHWETVPGNGQLVFQFNGGTPPAQTIDGSVTVVGPTATPPIGATPFGTPIVGTLQAGDTQRDNRLLRNSVSAGCTTKTCPGALGLYPLQTATASPTASATPIITSYPAGINTYRYDAIPFTNTNAAPTSFNFTTTVTGPGGVLPAIYSQPYNPTGNVCLNYVGDPGASAVQGSPISFSVTIPAGATYFLVMEGDAPIVSSSPSPPLPPINQAPAVVSYSVVVTTPGCVGATPTGTATPTNTATATFTATATATLTNTATPSATSTFTPTSTATATFTPTATATQTFTPTPTSTGTFTPTASATSTFTPTPTATGTFTPTSTATSTFTATATATGTFTPTPTATGTFTATPTATGTFTPTATATSTNTATPSATATFTPTASATSTFTSTPTATPTAPSVQFSSPTYQEDESQTAVITIIRTGNLTGTDTVTFSTSNGTAIGGGACNAAGVPGPDYISVIGQTVIFSPNDTSKVVNIPLCADGIIEADETVNLTLAGANIGVPGTAVLTINDTATGHLGPGKIFVNQNGAGNPYPSTITVSGEGGVIGSMRLTLYDMSANVPDNADFLLVGPGGRSMIIMANAGGLTPGGPATLNFTDLAGVVVPDNGPIATIDYEPTSFGTVANFPAPAPAGPYNLPGGTVGGSGTQTLAGNFNGISANGVWSLYVRDDFGSAGGVVGSIAGGWGLEFIRSTAAGASISGRVMTSDGYGIRNAKVVITGNSLIEPIVVQTGSFGWFIVDGLQTGETYVVTVNSQRYTFSTPSRVISLVDNVVDADFIANPQE